LKETLTIALVFVTASPTANDPSNVSFPHMRVAQHLMLQHRFLNYQ